MYFSVFVSDFKLLFLGRIRQKQFTVSFFILQFLVFFLKYTLLFPAYLVMLITFLMGILLVMQSS